MHSKTVALVNGRPRLFCCPACVLSEQEQEGKPIQITEMTSFLTGEKLSPDHAFVVKGSDVNMCAASHGIIDADKRPAQVRYDRCAPSLIAFGQRSEAMQFSSQHGGQVFPFGDIVKAFTH